MHTWLGTRESGQYMGQRLIIVDYADFVYASRIGRASFTSLDCACTKENSITASTIPRRQING